MNSRLLQFLTAENITQAQFADSIGVARASISHIISGRNKPSYEFISAMMRQYPQLNPEWLILGKGRMYNDGSRQAPQISGTQDDDLLFPADYDSPALATQKPAVQQETVVARPSKMNQRVFQDGSELGDRTLQENAAKVKETSETQFSEQRAEAQLANNQQTRRVSKIIIFFDDGTFQEMS